MISALLGIALHLQPAVPNAAKLHTVEKLRVWWAFNKASIGLPMAVAVVAIVCGILVWPVSDATPVTGRILSFGMRDTDQGSYRVASVSIGEATKTVRVRGFQDCRVGDAISLLQTRHWWGYRTTLPTGRQACERNPPPIQTETLPTGRGC